MDNEKEAIQAVRDYFAARAMQGSLASDPESYGGFADAECLAKNSYQIADAMLAERDRS